MKNLPFKKLFPWSNLHLQQASEFLVWVSYLLLPWRDTKNIYFKWKLNHPSKYSYMPFHRHFTLNLEHSHILKHTSGASRGLDSHSGWHLWDWKLNNKANEEVKFNVYLTLSSLQVLLDNWTIKLNLLNFLWNLKTNSSKYWQCLQ